MTARSSLVLLALRELDGAADRSVVNVGRRISVAVSSW
jgi:hypothetical protein